MEILVGDTLYFSAMMEAAATNCGLMIPQTPQLGRWLISTADWPQYPGEYMAILVGDTLYFSARWMASSGTELWAHQPGEITSLSSGSGGGSGGMTNVTGATCSVSPSLPTGLSIDSGTCTISGTPSVATTNTTYTVTAVMSGVTYQTTVWLSSAYLPLTPSVEGAELILDEAMTNITFQYNASAASGSGSGSGSGGMTNLTNATSCVASPSLPTGLSIDSSTCTISGTPTVATTNTTYTVTANISNVTYQPTVWLSSAYLPLTPSVEGAELILDEAMTNITFQYNSSAASGSGSGSNQSSFVNNIGLRTTSGSATQMINGTAITPIEFSLEWDNFSLPSNLSSNEKVTFPFDHSFNDTSSTPMENSTASNLTYDRHGREMHALDDEIEYGWSATNRSELAINSNTISLSLWVKPTNVGTVQNDHRQPPTIRP